MSRFYRFVLSFSIVWLAAFSLCLFTFIALPLTVLAETSPSPITQIRAKDFFEWGVDKILHGNYLGAVKDLTQAIQSQSDFAAAYSNRCLALIQLEDYQAAIEDCTRTSTLVPNNTEAYLNRGLAHYRLGNYLASIEDNNQVIQRNPGDFRAYYNRGVSHSELGNHAAAIVDYNQALLRNFVAHSSLLADIYNDRGLARFRLSDLKGAIADFSVAIGLNVNSDRAYYNRGCVCGRQGNYKAAMQDFTLSLQLNPDNAEAYLNRGIARYELGYQQEAIADLQQAVSRFTEQGNAVASQRALDFIQALRQELKEFPESELG